MIDGWTPFMYAAVNGYETIVDLLGQPRYNERARVMESPFCDVNATDRLQRNSLHWVIKQFAIGHSKKDNDEVVPKQLNFDSLVNDSGKYDGIPPELLMIKKLIELGVSYESKDIEGLSPLEMALNYASRGGYHY